MRRAARLGSVLYLLKANKSQTAEDLAKALNVNVRTIYRDIECLIDAGLPIRGTQGPSGGYVLAEHFPVDPFVYSRNEALSLISMPTEREATTVRQAIDSSLRVFAEALPKTAGGLLTHVRERFLFDTSNWFWRDIPLGHFPELKEAILNDQRVEVLYLERGKSTLKADNFDPYGMVWRQGHWYLVAFSHEMKRFERLRIQRIVSVRSTGIAFSRQSAFDLLTCWKGLLEDFGKGQTLVRIKIDFPATLDFEHFGWKEDQRITKREDHWIVEMRVDKYDWLIPLVLSYGGKVQVLEPDSVRKEIAEKVAIMAQQYGVNQIELGRDP